MESCIEMAGSYLGDQKNAACSAQATSPKGFRWLIVLVRGCRENFVNLTIVTRTQICIGLSASCPVKQQRFTRLREASRIYELYAYAIRSTWG